MTEKWQTSQGYIISILQHFATKLWNITNFVMLFQAVMKFLSRSEFSYKGKGPLALSSEMLACVGSLGLHAG
jgi:valyl-tRNA synthetase